MTAECILTYHTYMEHNNFPFLWLYVTGVSLAVYSAMNTGESFPLVLLSFALPSPPALFPFV